MDREYDVVVFGATGVTGKLVVEELFLYGGSINWAIAGRSKKKLSTTLAEVISITGVEHRDIGMIVADVSDESTIDSMCLQAKVVLSCVGPYRFYGEKVVESCIKNRTHYVDVCGEPQFLEEMQQKYFEDACANNVYVVGACGFDSIPCDMGVEFLRQKFIENDAASGHLNSVESFLEVYPKKDSKANFGTWQSAIYSLSHASELKEVRRKLRENVFPDAATVFPFPMKRRPFLFKNEILNKWCLPFPGSDKSIVMRTQMFRKQFENEKPVQIQTYFCVPSLLYAFLFMLMGAIFVIFSKFEIGRSLLERYPGFFSCGIFSKDPSSREQLTGGSFIMTLCGTGWSKRADENKRPDKKMTVQITRSDFAYVTTAVCCVAACKILLDENERKKMTKSGGVFTPAAAFARTKLIDEIQRRGVVITVVDDENCRQR